LKIEHPDPMNCENNTKERPYLQAIVIGILILLLFIISETANAQIRDSVKTGYLPDAAEEYWPAHQSGEKADFSASINHIAIRDGKGFISTGGYFREVYELFDNYLWGRGLQDDNGYFLHRAIVHGDFRYNKNFRFFAELESSSVTGRNGGARPVQDLDKLAVDQIFGEYSFRSKNKSLYSFRFGKQALNYGVGSLLDIRETNVRRSFFGGKFIMEDKNTKVDFFAMELMNAYPGFFDDQIDHTQKIAGAWLTQTFPNGFLNRLDAYYIYIHHNLSDYAIGPGSEDRHTLGTALNYFKNGWSSYTEADLQFGKFNGYSILAWKLAQTFSYQFSNTALRPTLYLQSAISSGDHDLKDSTLNTFNPIYPKAIYYGYVDNVGSANIFLIHAKVDIEPAKKLKVTAGYYSFWRQSTADGLYAANGLLLVDPSSDRRRVGSMFDFVALYAFNGHFSARAIATYYKREPFLQLDPTTPHDIKYLGISTTARF
jgi:hypothetical protein